MKRGRGGVRIGGAEAVAAFQRPPAKGAVFMNDDDLVGADFDIDDGGLRFGKRNDRFAGFEFPERNDAVVAARGEFRPIGRKSHMADGVAVSGE